MAVQNNSRLEVSHLVHRQRRRSTVHPAISGAFTHRTLRHFCIASLLMHALRLAKTILRYAPAAWTRIQDDRISLGWRFSLLDARSIVRAAMQPLYLFSVVPLGTRIWVRFFSYLPQSLFSDITQAALLVSRERSSLHNT